MVLPGGLNMDPALLTSFRFSVAFLSWGGGNGTVDTRFQSVSGLGSQVTTTAVREGGQNLFSHRLPEKVDYQNLTLARGRVIRSTLNQRFDEALSQFSFRTTDVLISLLGEDSAPVVAWMFYRAYPVKWQAADLNAKDPAILIDTMELAYTRMQPLHI